jgi:hypothetical protein
MAMTALKIGAPKDYMCLLEEHADVVNLPRVGVDENVAFPAVQANVAPAVALEDALGISNYFKYGICLYFISRKRFGELNGFFWFDGWSY